MVLSGTSGPFNGSNDASAAILTISNNIDGANLTLSGSALLAGSTAGVQAITNFSGLSLGGHGCDQLHPHQRHRLGDHHQSASLPFSIVSAALDNTRTNVVEIIYQTVSGGNYQLLSSPSALAALNTWTNEGASVTATGTQSTNVVPLSSAAKSYIVKHN